MSDDGRAHVLRWRSAVLNSLQTSTVKLSLLALAEWADADGGSCYPAIPSIAAAASLNEKSVRRSLEQAVSAGFILRAPRGSEKGWRRFDYLLTIPDGADTRPARSRGRVDTAPAATPATCGQPVRDVRTLRPDGADTAPTEQASIYPKTSSFSMKMSGEQERRALEPRALIETLHVEPTSAELDAERNRDREKYAELISMHGAEHPLVTGFRSHRPHLCTLLPAAAAGMGTATASSAPVPAAAPTNTEAA